MTHKRATCHNVKMDFGIGPGGLLVSRVDFVRDYFIARRPRLVLTLFNVVAPSPLMAEFIKLTGEIAPQQRTAVRLSLEDGTAEIVTDFLLVNVSETTSGHGMQVVREMTAYSDIILPDSFFERHPAEPVPLIPQCSDRRLISALVRPNTEPPITSTLQFKLLTSILAGLVGVALGYFLADVFDIRIR